MKCLVTGGAGFIGSAVCRHLIHSTTWSVLNLDKLTYAANLVSLQSVAGDPRYRFVRGDIADRHLVRKLFEDEQPDAVLNLAAETPVDRSIDAAAAFMRYWLGRLRWWLAPEKFKAAITATIRKVALEFMILIEAGTRLSDYAGVTAPTLLIVGGKTRAPSRAVIDMLSQALPNATVTVLKGAGHMSPFTHPSEVNRLIAGHLAAQRQQEPAPLPEA